MTRRMFVTGGASGLGRALALRYASAGYRVCIGDVHDARAEETLAELRRRGADAEHVRCDVTREDDLLAARARLEQAWGGVDVVINNAGVAQAGAIDAVSIDDWKWILDINLLGVVRGCRVFTPLFKRQRGGHFINIASMAGLLDMPYMSSYNATKAAVVSLSETLHQELSEHGIGVTVVCPSFFQTHLHESLRSPGPGLKAAMTELLARSKLSADDIADEVFRAAAAGEFYVLPHPESREAWALKRTLPRDQYVAAIEKQTRKLRKAAGEVPP